MYIDNTLIIRYKTTHREVLVKQLLEVSLFSWFQENTERGEIYGRQYMELTIFTKQIAIYDMYKFINSDKL